MPRSLAFKKPKGKYTQGRRLLELYDRLYGGGILHAGRLSEELGVARRTIERDLAELQEVLGTRVEYGEVPERGLRWAQRPGKWGTTRWQILAVALGARMTGFLSGRRFSTHVGPLMDRLRRSLPHGASHRIRSLERKIHVVESGQKLYRKNSALQRRLEVMLDGLLLDRPIELAYLSSRRRREGSPPRQMRVHALAAVIHRSSVYFIVDSIGPARGERGVRRLLSLDRVQDAVLDGEAEVLSVPRGFDAKTFLSGAFAIWTGEGSYRVKIRISPGFSQFVRERHWHVTEVIKDLRGGGIELSMELSELREVAQWVVGMGPDACVVGPPELERLVRQSLEESLAQYA